MFRGIILSDNLQHLLLFQFAVSQFAHFILCLVFISFRNYPCLKTCSKYVPLACSDISHVTNMLCVACQFCEFNKPALSDQ